LDRRNKCIFGRCLNVSRDGEEVISDSKSFLTNTGDGKGATSNGRGT